MASFNRVQIIGNLGRDPELRYTQNRTPVATLSVATTYQETTEWHRVVVWDKLAEQCALHLAKGRSVFVEGRLQTRSWDDANGQKRTQTEIIATTVQFLGSPLARPAEPTVKLAADGPVALAAAAEKVETWGEIPF